MAYNNQTNDQGFQNQGMNPYPQGGNQMQAQPNQYSNQQQGMPPQPQVVNYGGQPMGGNMGGGVQMMQVAIDTRTGIQKMNDLNSIFVKQKMSWAEVITGCEVENKYAIYEATENGELPGNGSRFDMIPPKFWAEEKSGCCERQCMRGDQRPFDINVYHFSNQAVGGMFMPGAGGQDKMFMRLHRECKCTCMCFNRPEMIVELFEHDNPNEGRRIGRIVAPWSCCDMTLDVYNEVEQEHHQTGGMPLYQIKLEGEDALCGLGICQCGVQWGAGCPCEACQTVYFKIQHGVSGQKFHNGAKLIKKSPGCIKAMISDADNFYCKFPPVQPGQGGEHGSGFKGATAIDKCLFMAATLLLDYQYFEEKGDKRKQNNGGHH